MNKVTFIEIRDLDKDYYKAHQKIEVLKGLNVSIRRGEIFAIVGASGVGKSTLLHIIGTLDHPTRGNILFNGEDVFTKKNSSLNSFRNKKIGFVFQFHYLMNEFSALENAMMPALVGGASHSTAKERAQIILNELGLGNRLHHKPGELSGGEQQRVAIARALINEPEIILADEPTGNLDTKTAREVQDLFLMLNETKKVTTLIVTHNEPFAKKLGRIVKLEDGIAKEL
jgi:lipoprotein-releasing system ATP-binding protein